MCLRRGPESTALPKWGTRPRSHPRLGEDAFARPSRSTYTSRAPRSLGPRNEVAMPRENLRFLFFCAALLRAVDASPADLSRDAEREEIMGALARGEDTRDVQLTGKGFEVNGPLANDVFAEAIDEVSDSVNAWTRAGERYDVAVREVVADSYRRHRAATMLQLV